MTRKVHFPNDDEQVFSVVCTVPHREDYTEEEIEGLFFSRTEFQSSRTDAKAVSRESERYGYSKYLDEAFTEKDPEIQEKLNAWAANGRSHSRGLERWANTDHGDKRQQEQFHAIMSVLRAQDEMLARKKEIDWEKLRKVSHKATKKSRHFARMMGKADSYAIALELRAEQVGEDSSLCSAMCSQTVASEEVTQATSGDDSYIVNRRDGTYPYSSDCSKDSVHEKHSRLGRFSFGRKSRDKESRVSRIA